MKTWDFHTANSAATYVSTGTRSKSGSTRAGTTDPSGATLSSFQAPRTSRLTAALGSFAALTLLAGCSAGSDHQHSPTSAPATTSASPAARWDESSHAAAELAAEKVLRTWSRPQVAYEAWWVDLKPLLSPEARQVYDYTDPQNIPALKITGKGVETNNDNPYVVTITFPTTKGTFGVDLSRTSIPGRWIGESIIFPGEHTKLQG